jgi:hypothetical protein
MTQHTTLRNVLISLVVLGTLAVAFLTASAPPAAAQGLWYAEYFPNPNLAGGPALTRYDQQINFNWGYGSPGEGIPPDNFSARWTREEWFEGGTYRFSYRSDDGIRIWVGDRLVVNDWVGREAYWSQQDRYIPQGTYTVRVEYFELEGTASIETVWQRITGGEAWTGEYFNNRELSGSPVLIRYDPAVDFDWGYGSPDPSVPADDFSVRWTYRLGFTPGTYRFSASTDDGVRVSVDGTRVVDAWYNQKLPNTHSGDITLNAGEHTVVVEYYEQGGEAAAHVWWNRLDQTDVWQGNYYANAELRGGPSLVRNDATISFDWGEAGPAPWMPADNFSARWTRQINFPAGNYRLNTRTDDGVRVYVDDKLVMDYWEPQDYAWNYLDNIYLSGVHTLKIEYFERTGFARIRFWWEPTSATPSPGGSAPPATPIPETSLPGGWQGTYYNTSNLSGSPALVRRDEAIAFDWGFGSPAAVVNSDNFSVRWDGASWFDAGQYTFTTFSDDGVRLYVDGARVIDSWYPMRGYRTATLSLSEGTHAVRVEYFESTGRAQILVSWRREGSPPVVPITEPTRTPVTCEGGPLRLDAWPVEEVCDPNGGWVATIFVAGHGGDCSYTYSWENQVKGGPTPDSMTFEVRSASRDIAIVGEAAVTSAGQTAEVELYVRHPRCHW